jgi:hypothetical protein
MTVFSRISQRVMAVIKGVMSSLWIFAIPKRPFDLIGVYPASVLAAAHYQASRDRSSLYLIGLALLWDSVMGFWLMVGVILRAKRSLLGTLMQLKDCSYKPIELGELLDPARRSILVRGSLLEYLKSMGLPWQHDHDVKIYRVDIGPSGTLPDGLASFNIPFLGAVLLVRDDPASSDARERFFLWHEVGHTMGDEFARQSMVGKGIKGPTVASLLSLLLLPWSLRSAAAVLMAVIALLILRGAFSRLQRSSRLDAEVTADRFAIQFMNASETEELRTTAQPVLPGDRDLDRMQRHWRVTQFREALSNPAKAHEWTDPSLLQFTADSRLGALNLLGWMSLMAIQFRPVGHRDIVWFSWGIILVAFLALVRYGLSYWLGILFELILTGSRCWNGNNFQFFPARPRKN